MLQLKKLNIYLKIKVQERRNDYFQINILWSKFLYVYRKNVCCIKSIKRNIAKSSIKHFAKQQKPPRSPELVKDKLSLFFIFIDLFKHTKQSINKAFKKSFH